MERGVGLEEGFPYAYVRVSLELCKFQMQTERNFARYWPK